LNYCKTCILPNTRPNLVLDEEGVCNACRSHNSKVEIDWPQREQDFRNVVDHAKSGSSGYDCIIPVSGGKDSTWQVVKCLEYGLNPLAVTWKTPARTEIGAKNLANLVSLGVDHIDYQVNPHVERLFMYKAFERFGSTAIPMHMALFNIPLNIATKFEIPLVVWGENSAFEYGSTEDATKGVKLDDNWLNSFGVTHGTTAKNWVCDELTKRELTPYFGPGSGQLEEKNILAVFLGYYFQWDPEITRKVALEHGFQVRPGGPKTGYYDYADIDDDFISIHHYIKWYKFGFTRLFDNLSLEIRNNRISREDALAILREKGEQKPDEDIKKACDFMGISENRFCGVIEHFRNHDIWFKDNGTWKIKNYLIHDWRWS
jgi:N-acetyl sugar amidotransferase